MSFEPDHYTKPGRELDLRLPQNRHSAIAGGRSAQICVEVDAAHPELLNQNTHETCGMYLWHVCAAHNAEDPSRPLGFLSKSDGENGYTWGNGVRTSHDAVCFSDNGQRFDIIGGAGDGSPNAAPVWQGPQPERASNVYIPFTAVPAPSGGTAPVPTEPVPGSAWTPAHSALLARMTTTSTPNAAIVRRVAEQFAFSFPAEGWGHKSAAANRPPSSDVVARRTPAGLIGYRIIPPPLSSHGMQGTPVSMPLPGQIFIEVTPQNHLGVPSPGPSPTPTPTPTPGPAPPPASSQPYPDDAWWKKTATPEISRRYPGGVLDAEAYLWIGRIGYSIGSGQTKEEGLKKALAELDAIVGAK